MVRHGESEFNAKSLWTGIWDIPLTDRGKGQAIQMGEAMADLKPDVAFTSDLIRAHDTLKIILHRNHWFHVPVHVSQTLNERDYGKLTGLNKWEVEKKYGDAQFQAWRRGWNEPVPGGETLKQVYERAVPYFESHILPELKSGHNVLLAAHGNTLRTLIKYLDGLSDEQVPHLEMPFGDILIYQFGHTGTITGREHRQIDTAAPPA